MSIGGRGEVVLRTIELVKLRLIIGLTAALRAAARAGRERNMAASIALVLRIRGSYDTEVEGKPRTHASRSSTNPTRDHDPILRFWTSDSELLHFKQITGHITIPISLELPSSVDRCQQCDSNNLSRIK